MFTGAYTALVTPFTRNGALDEKRLRALVETQIGAGIDLALHPQPDSLKIIVEPQRWS